MVVKRNLVTDQIVARGLLLLPHKTIVTHLDMVRQCADPVLEFLGTVKPRSFSGLPL